MKIFNRQSGVTLPEMMTAVAITLIMLAASGMIFTSASRSSGKAMALSDMMKEARAITGQLEKDLSGLRGDLPFAFIFEGYDPTGSGVITERRDRMVFFTNGDYVDIYDRTKLNVSNTARIFYGQSGDTGLNQNPDSIGLAENRRILSRRAKMVSGNIDLTSNYPGDWPPDSNFSNKWYASPTASYSLYDFVSYEYGPDSFWKTAIEGDFFIWLNAFGINNGGQECSFLRRPIFTNESVQYIQQLFFANDVTDFKVQLWVPVWDDNPVYGTVGIVDYGEIVYRWYPNDDDLTQSMVAGSFGYGLCWNTSINSANAPFTCDQTELLGALPQQNIDMNIDLNHWWGWWNDSTMPRAIKISFKLYDKNRTHYPEGRQFEYMFKVPNTD